MKRVLVMKRLRCSGEESFQLGFDAGPGFKSPDIEGLRESLRGRRITAADDDFSVRGLVKNTFESAGISTDFFRRRSSGTRWFGIFKWE
ncbi:MAG: hypothetical protein LBH51_04390 [Treponema sp.]|nr:hypothetical protein [Treponema sp.]